MKKNLNSYKTIIKQVKQFIRDTYPIKEELPKSQDYKRNIEIKMLEEYSFTFASNNNITRYFNLLVVQFLLNPKENTI